MKKTLFIMAWAFMSTPVASAQDWCPPGAVWYHAYADAQAGDFGYVRTEYAGDSLVGGSVCQWLVSMVHGYSQQSQSPFNYDVGSRFTRGQGDLVELWNGISFDTLYWFGASPGDGWTLGYGWGGLVVLDTGTLQVDGLGLRYLLVQFDGFPAGPQQDTIVERIGFLNYYWDSHSTYLLDTGLDGLRCYSDMEIEHLAGSLPCDYILGTPGSAGPVSRPRLFPNPGHDLVWLDADMRDAGQATVYDGRGAAVLEGTVKPGVPLDMAPLAPGLYTMVLRTSDGRHLHFKWMKG